MTQDEIMVELLKTACDGNEDKFKELSKQLDDTEEMHLFIGICANMFMDHPNIKVRDGLAHIKSEYTENHF